MSTPGPITLLPHKPPFLFLSRMVELAPGESGLAAWDISGDEDFFRGHFPDQPLVPGVLLLEALAQLGGLVAFANVADGLSGGRLARADVKFKAAVVPPATVLLSAKLERTLSRLRLIAVEAKIGNDVAVTGTLMLASVAKDGL